MTEQQLWDIIKCMSIDEKAALVSGADDWNTKELKARGIPPLTMADGPHGLRLAYGKNNPKTAEQKKQPYNSKEATCFPTESCLACSFSEELVKQVGEAIAEECLENGVGLLLGPGVNIKRSPLGGRNFEYFSEDPVVSGRLAAAYIEGVQAKGVGACIKHYAANNQETKRMSINSVVDDRALFDIYLKPFEIAIKKANPAGLMASYNRINGEFATENRRLLTDVLRIFYGYKGCVISDWGAVNQRYRGVMAGMDLEMPYSGNHNAAALLKAVKDGMLLETSLDTACFNILRLVFQYTRSGKPRPAADYGRHHKLSIDALCKSAVLLKNDGLLPLGKNANVAVVGELAQIPRIQGSGSSIVNPRNTVNFLSALHAAGVAHTYAKGYEGFAENPALLQEAREKAAKAEAVLLFVGLPDISECETYDRPDLRLPQVQVDLIHALAEANPNLTVVLVCGAPVETPWLGKVRALLYPGLGGEGFGEALYRLLFGQLSPGGKLAETWPVSLESTPTYKHFPMGPTTVTYNESIFVGYRYYEKVRQGVQFAFGHGLSYTSFSLSALALSHDTLPVGRSLMAHINVKNTGPIAGDEIVFIYAANTSSRYYTPPRELKGFGRVHLKPGETKSLQIHIPYDSFAIYDPEGQNFIVESGSYDIIATSGPGDEVLKREVKVRGKNLIKLPSRQYGTKSYYAGIKNNLFPEAEFQKLFPQPMQAEAPASRGSYRMTTTLGEMQGSKMAARLLRLASWYAAKSVAFCKNKKANAYAGQKMAEDLPFKNIMLFTGGSIGPKASKTLLDMCNGKKGMARLLHQLIMRR